MTEIYAAFCGCGKSYLCNKYPCMYSELECWGYRDGDFPKNYVDDIITATGKSKYLFISTDPVILNELNKRGIKIKLFYPDISLRNEYLDRFILRKSPYDFIGVFMTHWNQWIIQLDNINFCERTVMKSGEYLQDVIEQQTKEHKSDNI